MLRTRVTKLEVQPNGWRVYASITNDGNQAISIDQPDLSMPVIYPQQGMSLVISPSTEQLAQGNHRYTINSARAFIPAIPRVLQPHQTWTGSFAGIDAVPANRQIHVGFGMFTLDTRPQSVSTSHTITIH